MQDKYVEAFLIRETEKARLLELRDVGETWVPKSVTKYIRIDPVPANLIGKLPGKPVLIEVEPWFRRKNEGFQTYDGAN